MRRPKLRSLRTLGKNRAFGVIALGLLIGAGLIIWWSMAQPDASKAAWFDDRYTYRQTISVTNTGAAQTDYQVAFTLDTQTLITAGKMKSDCSDIAIVTTASKILPYWIEKTTASACNTTTTKIWTKMPSIPLISSGVAMDFFVYYGNPAAYNAQDGRATFVYFDDFSNNTLGNFWTEADPSNAISITNGKLTVASGRAAWDQAVYLTSSIARGDYAMEFEQYVSAGTNYFMSGWKDDGAGASYTNFVYAYYEPFAAASSITGEVYEDGSARGAVTATFTTGAEIKARVRMRNSGGAYYDYSTNGGVTFTNSYTSTYSTESTLHPGWTIYNGNYTFDNFFVRKDAATPPTIAAPANEERTPAPVAYWKFDEGTGNLTNNANGGADITTGLVGYWNNNETSWNGTSGEVKDQTQFANNGTAVGGVSTTASGKYSYAGSFDGTDDVVTTPDTASLTLNGPFTISVWVYPTTLPTSGNLQSIVSKYDGGANSGGYDLRLYNDSGTQKIGLTTLTAGGTPGGSDIAYTLPTNTWSLLTAMYDGTNSIIYVNGVLAGTAANTAAPGDNTKLLNIGNFGYYTVTATTLSRYFAGRIDEVRLYNKLLNTTQMNTLYNLGPEGTLAGSTKPTWQTEDQCISGKCLYFNGTTSYVMAAPYGGINTTEGTGLTVGAWVKMTQTGATQVILTKQQNTTNEFFYTLNLNSSNQAEFSVGKQNVSGNTATGATTLVVDQWYYLVGTYDGTNVKVFVNSRQDGSTTEGFSSSTQNLSAVNIGRAYNDTQFFKGFIDEPKIYNYVRTAAQLQTDFNARGSQEGSSANLGNNITNMPAALSNGLTAYWKMDESSWTNNCSTATVLDSSGNGNTGTACPNTTGPTGGASGKFGNGGSFDGSNDYLNVGSLAATTNGTVSMWINRTAGTQDVNVDNTCYGTWFGRQRDGVSSNLMFCFTDNTNYYATFYLGGPYGGNPVTGTTTIPAGSWTHVTATWEGTTTKIYVNGVLENTITNATADTGGAAVTVGGAIAGWAGYFTGKMDDARLYNRTLSADEVKQLASWAPGPDGYWGLNEGSGISAFDQSGYGINGTLTGSPSYDTGKYGKAVSLNGTNSWINLGSTSLARKVNAITLMAWVNIRTAASGSNQSILNISINNSGTPTNSSRAVMDIYSDGTITSGGRSTDAETIQNVFSTADAPVNEWVHLASVIDYENDTITIYQNGVKQATTGTVSFSSTQTADSVSASGSIGSDDSGTQQYFPGKIDEAKVYKYARTPAQIIQDMNAGHPAGGSPIGSAIGYWKFNEGADNTCTGGSNDACNSGSSGSTLDGAGSGFASPATSTSGWTSAGKFGKALSFDGTNDYISVGSEDTFDLTGDMAMSLWFKSSSSTSQMMVAGKHDCGSNNGYFFRQNAQATGDIQFQHSRDNNTPITISGSYNDGNWHHLVGVISGSTSYIYVDGKPRGSQALSVSYTSNSIPFQVGTVDSNACGFGTSSYNGQIDEVKFYTGALTASQVALEYNQSSAQVQGAISDNSTYQLQAQNQEYCVPGDSTSCAAPVVEYKFNNNSSATQFDSSGNGINGTASGSPPYVPGPKGKGLSINGTSQYSDLGSNKVGPLINGASQITISGWLNVNSYNSARHRAVQIFIGDNSSGLILNQNASDIEVLARSGTGDAATNLAVFAGPTVGTWFYVAGVIDIANDTITMYKNGVNMGTTSVAFGNSTWTQSSPGATDHDALGALYQDAAVSQWFDGKMSNIRIYNYGRTAAQVAWEYNKGGPVGWWKMDECQGTTINDSAGNSLTGTLTNATPGTCTTNASTAWYNGRTGKINSSISFDGTDDYISVTSTTALNPKNITISGWINADTFVDNGPPVACKGDGGGGEVYCLDLVEAGNNQPRFYFWKSATYRYCTLDTVLLTGTWYHLTATYDGSNAVLYVNGLAHKTCSLPYGDLDSNSHIVSIGSRQSGGGTYDNNFDGRMDDVRIYNYPLTRTQVKTLYNNGALNYAPTTGAP